MKKHFALILTILMLLSAVPFGTLAAESDTGDMEFLKGIGILEEDFSPSTVYVTRAEAAMILTRCAAAIPGKGESVFSDVLENQTYAAEIALAHKLGIISGFGDGTFQPNRSVTAGQMVKMLVTLAGYGQNAEALGGYLSGYLTVAVQKDIVKTSIEADKPLSYENMATLVRAAMEAPLRQAETFEDGNVKYVETAENMLSAWHGIEMKTGLVTANYVTTLSASRTVKKDEVAIDGVVYKAGTSSAPSFICRKITAYIDVDEETVLYARASGASAETVVNAENIVSATKDKIVYENGASDKTVSISGAVLLKNGVEITPWVDKDLDIESGVLRLVSSTGASVDYILAEVYVNRVVDSVNLLDKTVRFTDGKTVTVDTDSTSLKTVFEEANGRPASLDYTYPMDIFSVMESKDVLKIIRSAKLIIGKVEEISTDSVTIDGKVLSVDPAFSKSADFAKIAVGVEADFYLDYTGKLAAIDRAHAGIGTYGLLVSGHSKTGLAAEAQVRIFTSEGTWQGFELADTVNLDGTPTKEGDVLIATSPLVSDGKVFRQMIQYEVNADGEINKIQTAADFTANPDDEARLQAFSKDAYIDENRKMNGETISFRDDDMQIFSNRFRVKDGVTKVFVVPKTDGTDEDYSIVSADSLLGGSYVTINTDMTFYEVDENYLVSAIVWEKDGGGKTEPNHEMDYLFVSRVYQGVDKDGMPEQKIEGYLSDGKTKILTVEDGFETYFGMAYADKSKDDPSLYDAETGKPVDKVSAKAIKAGDLIQYQATASGVATLLNVVARGGALYQGELCYNGYTSGKTGAVTTPTKFGPYYTYSITCSTAQRSDKDSLITKILIPGKPEYIRVYPAAKCVVLFDSEKGTASKITMQDIMPDDIVLTVHATQTIKCMAVYR